MHHWFILINHWFRTQRLYLCTYVHTQIRTSSEQAIIFVQRPAHAVCGRGAGGAVRGVRGACNIVVH